MLFTCLHCSFGHSVMNVEKFYSISSKKHVYLCKEHLDKRDDDIIHIPWDDQFIQESNIKGTCSLCESTRAPCVGFTGPKRPLLPTRDNVVPSWALQ